MALSRLQVSILQVSVLGLGTAVLLATQNIDIRAQAQIAAPNAERTTTGNPITGEGLPNPAPVVTRNWGQLPAGRKWGTTGRRGAWPLTPTATSTPPEVRTH